MPSVTRVPGETPISDVPVDGAEKSPGSPSSPGGATQNRARPCAPDATERCGSSAPSIARELSAAEAAMLKSHGFDEATFSLLRAGLAGGLREKGSNTLDGEVKAPREGVVQSWPVGNEAQRLRELGTRALERGEVACLVLNGGMATRFGGVVKGVVPVLGDRSFLNLKLSDVERTPGNTPVFLMNSFATDSDTRAHVAEMGIDVPLHYVHQNISLRLRPDGEIYRDSKGAPSFYAPGHGDVFPALQRSAEFREWAKAGGKAVMVSNVDNLAATLDPLVVGAYLECGKRCMVEVAPKWDGDAGGAPAEVNGRVEIVEGFRFPPDFDQDSIPVFNTNTMWFDASVFLEDAPLQWYRADKKVGGDPVVQFERLMGERTSSLDSAYLEVPRDGAQGRFMPVKAPADLDTLRPEIKARLGA